RSPGEAQVRSEIGTGRWAWRGGRSHGVAVFVEPGLVGPGRQRSSPCGNLCGAGGVEHESNWSLSPGGAGRTVRPTVEEPLAQAIRAAHLDAEVIDERMSEPRNRHADGGYRARV